MRAIDADKLEKALENSCSGDSETLAFVNFMGYVDEQPTIEVSNRWVDVKDRLPDKEFEEFAKEHPKAEVIPVLGTIVMKSSSGIDEYSTVDKVFYNPQNRLFLDVSVIPVDVVAWMKLPKAHVPIKEYKEDYVPIGTVIIPKCGDMEETTIVGITELEEDTFNQGNYAFHTEDKRYLYRNEFYIKE